MPNPPITIGELTDVPAPGSPLSATWSQEVSGRVRHRFATVSARDTAWPAATAGSGAMCVTLDTYTTWTSNGTAWIVMPGTVLRNATTVAPDAHVSAPGLVDVLTQSMTFPVPVTVTVHADCWYGNGGTGFLCSWEIAVLTGGTVPASRTNLTPDGTWKSAALSATYAIPTAGPDAGFKLRFNQTAAGDMWRGAFVSYLVTAT